jgi:VIT1/CCC1 family predicted Fe2+/Mn2+ transporter
MKRLGKKDIRTILVFQKNEITEHHIYLGLARSHRNRSNKKVLEGIADDEFRHYRLWKKFTCVDVSPNFFKVWRFLVLSRIFGITFCIKLMEGGEEGAQVKYGNFASRVHEAGRIMDDEAKHEKKLIAMIDEERLKYIGSVVLGLNDALVELTGTLAGLTFALQNAKLIGTAGLITGIAASLSMAASEYLSTKTEGGGKDPLKASIYTGITYTGAVLVLVLPYLLLQDYFVSLAVMFLGAVSLIFVFTYYFSVVREVSFRERFLEMVGICLGVSAISFLIGLCVRAFLGINI